MSHFGPPPAPARRIPLLALPIWLISGWAAGFEGRVVLPDGSPVAGAEVSILGSTPTQRTSLDGTFQWLPDPVLPFEVRVVLPGGRYMKPILVERLPERGEVTIAVAPLAEESVTVTAGAAPTIEAAPASGTTIVPRADIEARQPLHLTQVLENVAGVSQVENGRLVFSFHDDRARSVSVAGSFNGWLPSAGARIPAGSGHWRLEIAMPPPGRYRYKFVLDGSESVPDPSHGCPEADSYGGFDSVVEVPPAPTV